jgi:hypothetical protein
MPKLNSTKNNKQEPRKVSRKNSLSSKVKKSKSAPADGTDSQSEENKDLSLEQENEENSKKDWTELLEQVQSEYTLSWWFMKPKWDEWALRLKLYNNQKRDKSAVGDPLLFTIHQTVLASLYDDRLISTFEPRETGDDDVAENLNDLATYDYDEMEKDVVDYTWDWDTSFFGRGLVMLMEFDREKKAPVPENWDPMTILRDPRAKSVNGDMKGRGRARFIGREIRLTKQEMKDAGVYFGYENLRADSNDINSLIDKNEQLRQEAQGYANVTRFDGELKGDNATQRLLEWFTHHKGKLVLVTLADNRKRVVRYTELKSKRIPIIDRALYPIANDWDGVSIPDLVEDKQRARAKLTNLGIKVAESSLYPMYLFDTNRIKNKADLNFEMNKFIGVDGNPSGAVQVMNKEQLKSDVNYILTTLDVAAQKATATPDLQQGSVGGEKRTATELSIVNNKVDTRYSLSAKIFGWSEKRFWQQWYYLYKTHFVDGIDEKTVRISGVLGAKFRPLRRANIIASVDPDVKIESRVLSEAKRYNQLQVYRGYLQMVAQDPNANLRYGLKQMGKLSGLKKDEIDMLMPPTIDEMIAEDENVKLEKNEIVMVEATDDHVIHLEIHNKLSDTPAKYAHIEAHKKAMILRKVNPSLFPQVPSAANPTGGAGIGDTPLPEQQRGSHY